MAEASHAGHNTSPRAAGDTKGSAQGGSQGSAKKGLLGTLKSLAKSPQKITSTLVGRSMKSPSKMKGYMNLWPPLSGSGVKMTHISDDWSKARIELNLHWWNANMHGAAFGGTLFAMTDVMFGTLVARYLGKDFEAWTRTGTFQFLSPGRDGAYLDVEITPELGEWMRATVAEDGYANVPYTSVIRNKDGSIVGIGQQDLHVRPRGGGKRAEKPQQATRPRGLVLESLATAVVWHCFKDQPEILTVLMSEQRRIPDPEDQMRHVVKVALEKSDKSREDLLALDIPEHYLPAD